MKVSRELKTAAIAISGIALFIWGFSYIKGENLFETPRFFYAEYDNVQGLLPSAGVTINGLKVGKIETITFHPTRIGRLIVKFSLENDFQFSNTSIAKIYSPDFISGKSLKIIPSYKGSTAVSGDTLEAKVETDILGSIGNQLVPLQEKITSFITNADAALKGLNDVFDEESRINLKQSFEKLNNTLSDVSSISKSLNMKMADNGVIDSLLINAKHASVNLKTITDSLASANLAGTINKLEGSLDNFNTILAQIEQGKGTVGKLLKDDSLYQNLEGATKEMEELLRAMKENPKRFVHFSLFGKKQKPYKETESPSKKD